MVVKPIFLPKRLRRIIDDNCFGQITAQNSQVLYIVAIDENAVLAKKAIPGKSTFHVILVPRIAS